MGRSSKEEAARTRIRIVEKASELFRMHGVDEVSVSDVMSALGLTTGGFYKHFASKDQLISEAFDLAFAQSISTWRRTADDKNKVPAADRAKLVAHYLRPNPAVRCPMIAFAPHAASGEAGKQSCDCYQRGAEALFESFVGPPNSKNASQPPAANNREAMLLFAAMIGARVLREAASDAQWIDELCNAVLEAASE